MEAWNQFLTGQESELGKETVLKWLHPLKIIRFDACNLYLEAKDSFQINWFEEHIRPKIIVQLLNNNKKRIKVHLSLAKEAAISDETLIRQKTKQLEVQHELIFDTIDPHLCFEEYIDPKENPIPFKLLSQLDLKQVTFNPIYLYGESGRGKTHLLMATAQRLRQQGLKVLYVRADTFTEHVVAAIRAGEMSAFRQAYRCADVLLVDDVQIFARKAATQEEFFHTFNTLHLAGRQIILAANCAPQELSNIEPRLISRFEWGVVLPLTDLSKEEKIAMLETKAKALKSPLPSKMTNFLLETFKSTKSIVKALQAFILRTHLNKEYGHLTHAKISIAETKVLLNDLIIEEQKNKLNASVILQHVAEYFGLLPEDLTGKAQSRDRVLPRQLAMYLFRKELQLSFTKIGEFFCKDHSTVMSSVKNIQKAIDNAELDKIDILEAIRKRLR